MPEDTVYLGHSAHVCGVMMCHVYALSERTKEVENDPLVVAMRHNISSIPLLDDLYRQP